VLRFNIVSISMATLMFKSLNLIKIKLYELLGIANCIVSLSELCVPNFNSVISNYSRTLKDMFHASETLLCVTLSIIPFDHLDKLSISLMKFVEEWNVSLVKNIQF